MIRFQWRQWTFLCLIQFYSHLVSIYFMIFIFPRLCYFDECIEKDRISEKYETNCAINKCPLEKIKGKLKAGLWQKSIIEKSILLKVFLTTTLLNVQCLKRWYFGKIIFWGFFYWMKIKVTWIWKFKLSLIKYFEFKDLFLKF